MAATAVHPGAMTPSDLAELLGEFNKVTLQLERTHAELRAEVRRLREELGEAHARLERSRRLASLGEMAAGIAHEVRNPLGSIRLYARMLAQDLAGMPSERAIAGKIEAATRALDGIVSDVLAFAREQKIRVERVAAGDLVERSLELYLPLEGTAIDVRREGGSGEWLDCDAGLVTQALGNVIRNAAEAMAARGGEGHTLTVAVSRRAVRGADGTARDMVVIGIGDTGGGIPCAAMERMFNPFFTTRASGTGLGLAIVHRIVDAHAGCILVRNSAGDPPGAMVELCFPPVAGADEVNEAREAQEARS